MNIFTFCVNLLMISIFLFLLFLYYKEKKFYRQLIDKLIFLLRMVKHDLNNDLQLIYGYAQLSKPQKIIDYINYCKENYNFISNLKMVRDASLLDCLLDTYFLAQKNRVSISLEIIEEMYKGKLDKKVFEEIKSRVQQIINNKELDEDVRIIVTIRKGNIGIREE